MSIKIKSFFLGPMDNIIYLMIDEKSKEVALIDPAWNIEEIENEIKINNYSIKYILLTHTHYDHTNAIDKYLQIYPNLPIYLSEQEYNLNLCNINSKNIITYNKSNTEILLGEYNIEMILTAGHTIGSVCFYVDNKLISGDTLFIYGCGRCDFKESDIEQMFYSLQYLKKHISQDSYVYPGHNYGIASSTTMKQQLLYNPYLKINNLKEFIDFRKNYKNQIPFQPQ